MKLEAAIKHLSPKSQRMTDSPPATSSDRLSSGDMAAALGMASAKASFGMSVYLGNYGVSKEDQNRAIDQLTQYAKQQAPKHVGKLAGKRLAQCMAILAKFAYTEYSNSAAKINYCVCCNGSGWLVDETMLENALCSNVMLPVKPEAKPIARSKKEKMLCKTCNGKGVLSNRCRCNGTGQVLDRQKTQASGTPQTKVCPRCAGRGYKRVPASVAYTAITTLLPELNQSAWSRHWKPFYQLLVVKCAIEESKANSAFLAVTGERY